MGKRVSLRICSVILLLISIAIAILFAWIPFIGEEGVTFILVVPFAIHLICSIGMFMLKRWAVLVVVWLSIVIILANMKDLLQSSPSAPIGLIVYAAIFGLSFYGLIHNDSLT